MLQKVMAVAIHPSQVRHAEMAMIFCRELIRYSERLAVTESWLSMIGWLAMAYIR